MLKPTSVGDDVLASGADGTLVRVDATSGRLVWSVKTDSELSTGPGTDGRVIAVASSKGMVYAYDANGGKLWEESVGTQVLTEPLVSAGVVVVRTIDSRIIGLDAATGKRRWVNQRNQSPLSLRTSYGMLGINNEVLITGFNSGKFGMLAVATGALIWEATLAPPKGYSEIERLSDITAKPSLVGTRMCLVSYQGKVGCGDAKTSNITWTKDFSSSTGTVQNADRVFVANDKSGVFAFQASNGQELWRNESLVWRDLSEPMAVGKVLIYGDAEGYLHTFSQDNGTFLNRVRVDSSPIVAAPLAVGGVIVVQTKGGTLAGYRP
jgi:outer membrane protein assembly factor BamB